MRGGGPETAPPMEVRIEPARRGELSEIVSAPGQLQPRTKVMISAKATARIMAMPFEEGAHVKQGAVVVQLDSKELEALLQAAQAEHDAQAGARRAERAPGGAESADPVVPGAADRCRAGSAPAEGAAGEPGCVAVGGGSGPDESG